MENKRSCLGEDNERTHTATTEQREREMAMSGCRTEDVGEPEHPPFRFIERIRMSLISLYGRTMSTSGSPQRGMTESQPTRRPFRFSFSNLSIEHRLPLLIGSLLFVVIVASTWAAYRGVNEAALEVGRERLLSLTQQLASLSQQSTPDLLSRTSFAANDHSILDFLQSPSAVTQPGASAILQQFVPPKDPNGLQVELWRPNHSVPLIIPSGALPKPVDLQTEFEQCSSDPFRVVGAINIVNDVVVFPAVAAVRDNTGGVVGFLVRWRRISPANPRTQLAELLGSEAKLYYGNSRGDVWTDLVKAVPKPPSSLVSTLEVTHYIRDGKSVMALGRPIIGTPWFVVVEFPDQALLTHVGPFLRRMTLISVVLLLIGLAGALALSRSITRPLHSLTSAASAIAAGNYSRLVDVRSRDELGALASAFNAMATKVRDAQHDLEQKVRERTVQFEVANRELEAFSYSVSHDLRAPLRHINGFSQALLEDYDDRLDDEGKGYLQELRSASLEMSELIDDLLKLAQVTRSEMRREVVNISEMVHCVAARLQKIHAQRTLVVNIEDGLLIRGDKRLLQIALSNLLENAWKFTSKVAEAEISFGRVEKGDESSYFVRDNGAGFDIAYVGKLFGAFQRLHTAAEFAGTGVGLATVQRIVQRHGGRVWAEGAVNKGATFYFTVPTFKENNDGEQSDLAGGRQS
jgi:signal transduction histidine kinase